MNRPKRVMFVFGTRPEAIKLCPVILHMKGRGDEFCVRVCATAQHREMLDQVLELFEVTPDADLNLMKPGHPVCLKSRLIRNPLTHRLIPLTRGRC